MRRTAACEPTSKLDLLHVDGEDLLAALDVGLVDGDLAIKPAYVALVATDGGRNVWRSSVRPRRW